MKSKSVTGLLLVSVIALVVYRGSFSVPQVTPSLGSRGRQACDQYREMRRTIYASAAKRLLSGEISVSEKDLKQFCEFAEKQAHEKCFSPDAAELKRMAGDKPTKEQAAAAFSHVAEDYK